MARAAEMTKGQPVAPFTPQIKQGEYVWLPEVSPAGPVVLIVNLPEQLLYVYRNGVRIGRSSISSGKPGHRTPTGVFTILQKNVKHVSTIYKGASMPYMERLTWGGVALHAGNVPGYPAAHFYKPRSGRKMKPVVVYLHGRGGNPEEGCRQWAKVARGELAEAEALRLMVRDTQRYAKRQMTWFAREPEIQWLDVDEVGGVEGAAESIHKHILREGWIA